MKIGLIQINNSFSGQNYFPYSVGLLQAYIQRYVSDKTHVEFMLPIYKRVPVADAVESLQAADLVFFSAYVWNARLSLAIAKRLKEVKPEIVIVFGGPHVPHQADAFLRENPFIDLVCHNEGEQVSLHIVENFEARTWSQVPSISFIDEAGQLVHTQVAPRIKSLDDIPSPYLEGVFEPLMAANPDEQWLIMWETNRGCPFSCTFCDWGSATQSKVYQFSLERLFKEIDWIASKKIEFIFCCDANFGILKRDIEIAQYVVDSKLKTGYPKALSVQNTKNARDRAYAVQKLLSDHGLNKGVTISLQSVDQTTLTAIKRDNISTADFQELQHRFTRDGVATYTDMIIGLPGETYDSFVNGIATIIAHGQHNRIQFGNLSILPNAEMGSLEYQRRYDMQIVDSKIINLHGSLLHTEEIQEMQKLVVSTSSMPEQDWVRTRAVAWMTGLLHFDKLLQIPFLVLHKITGISYRRLIECFIDEKYVAGLPVLSSVRATFLERAKEIQAGGPEYSRSEEYLNIWWPDDELVLIKLCAEGQLDAFYREATTVLRRVISEEEHVLPAGILEESMRLNQSVMKLPHQDTDLRLELSFNLWEFFQGARRGVDIELANGPHSYLVDRTSLRWSTWEDWCREVVWYGNKRGAYIYTVNLESAQATLPKKETVLIEGHH